jgi:hypothetical protein
VLHKCSACGPDQILVSGIAGWWPPSNVVGIKRAAGMLLKDCKTLHDVGLSMACLLPGALGNGW